MKLSNLRNKRGRTKEVYADASVKKPLDEKECIVCGQHTNHVATVYLGRQETSADDASSIEWQPCTMALCPDCAAQELDSRGFGVLVYVALQVCWIPLFTHGISGLGLGGAAIAAWALVCLARTAGQTMWCRIHVDDGMPLPEWLRTESAEERDSRALRDVLQSSAPGTGLFVDTLAEHRRREK